MFGAGTRVDRRSVSDASIERQSSMIAALLAVTLSAGATPLVIVAARRWRLVDEPNHRSSHTVPTPRGGGMAVAAAATVSLLAFEWSYDAVALCAGALALGVVGLVDDRRNLSAGIRLTAQIAVPLVVLAAVIGEATLLLPLAVVFVAGYTNAFNFMDGINGISGLQTVVVGVYVALLSADAGLEQLELAGLVVAGAAAGFLPYNAFRAYVFLGDVGSYFLGFWLACLGVLIVDAGVPVLVASAAFLLYATDTSVVLVRRLWRRERVTEAHREHAYQRLVQFGWSHVVVASICAGLTAAACAIMYAVRGDRFEVQALAFTGALLLIVSYLLVAERLAPGPRKATA